MRAVQCPSCEARLQVPAQQPPVRVICPRCKFLFLPPSPAPTPPGAPEAPPAPRARVVRRPAPAPLPLDDDPEESDRTGRPVLILGLVGVFVLVLAAGGGAAWWLAREKGQPVAEETPAPKAADPVPAPVRGEELAPGPLTGEQVYSRLLKSTVFILHVEKDRRGVPVGVGCGSGALIHKSRRLVVTNYHVVQELDRVSVSFPAFGPGGEVITEPAHYIRNSAELQIPGKVVARNPGVDLALVELERLPDTSVGLPLAARPATPGATVYSVGGSGVKLAVNLASLSGALWRFSTGTVRGRHREKLAFEDGQKVDAMFLETQKPSNPGDSGGPTVNDRGELVAVVSAGNPRADLVKLDIDLTEVRSYLSAFAAKNGWTWQDQAPASPDVVPGPVARKELPTLLTQVRTGAPDARVDAMRRLGLMKDAARAAVPALVEQLDDPDERVRLAAAAALDQIGPPAREDLGCVGKALAGAGKFGRVFALRYYSTAEKAPRDRLPAVIAALDDRDAEVREAALRAVAFYGPDSKSAALDRLLARALDPDPAVAAAAARVLTAFGPYDGAERKLLVDNLRAPAWGLRYLSVVHLTAAAPDGATALEWFGPRLADESAEVRAVALPALGKWGPAAKTILPAALALTRDENVRVRTAAVRTVGEIGGGPGAVAALVRFLEPDTAPALREQAVRALLAVEMTEPATDVPVLATLLKSDDPATRAGALASLTRLGPAAVKEVLPAVTECLKSPDPAVRLNALKAVAAAGPDAAALAPQVAELAARPSTPAAAPPAGKAAPAPATPPAPLSGEQITDRLRKSAAWIIVERFGQQAESANAALIDAPNRLLLTTYHITAAGNSFVVCFPVREGGELKSSPSFYAANLTRLARAGFVTTGRVVAVSQAADLALIRLDTAPPPGTAPMPLAREGAGPGEVLHTVGAPDEPAGRQVGVLWRYSRGKAETVLDYGASAGGAHPVSCRVLETDIPPGLCGSGGAVANERGELVGVVTTALPTRRGMGFAIDLGPARGLAAPDRPGGRPPAGPGVPAPAPAAGGADPVQLQAIATLGRLGPTAVSALAKVLDDKLPQEINVRICEVLAECGPDVPAAAVPFIVQTADRDTTLRPVLANLLVRIGGDEVVKGLKERTAWSFRTSGGRKEKVTKYPSDLQVWATQTLGKVDPKRLSDKERTALKERLEGLSAYHPDDEVRIEAGKSLAKLLAAGLKPEKKP